MIINLEPYQLFMIIAASFGAFFGLAKYIAKQAIDNINEKFKEVKDEVKQLSKNTLETERDLLRIKGEIAQQYVRRDDFVRLETHLTVKLDALGDKIDNLRERRVSQQ